MSFGWLVLLVPSACERKEEKTALDPTPPASASSIQQRALEIRDSSLASESLSASAPAIPPPILPKGLEAKPVRKVDPVHVHEDSDEACPENMVLVSGEYCPGLGQSCLEWVQGGVRRCARFANSRCVGPTFKRRFCIDRYEYPNLPGVKPVVMVSFFDALRACETEGKRLCLASEWTFACEGNQRYPYPYGYERDRRVCNFDRPRPSPEPIFELFSQPRKVGAEVTRLDMRLESGVLEGCVSPFGVHDMTGNVDEWVLNEDHFDMKETEERKPPFISGLKGGYWGPIRAACRPITTAHNESFRFYQVGFRCCANAKSDGDGVADRYTSRLKRWREQAGLLPGGGPIERPPP